jgi:hypothetical protein
MGRRSSAAEPTEFPPHQDIRARINKVRIADDAVDVDVEGTELDGLVVESPGDVPGPMECIWRRHGTEPVLPDYSIAPVSRDFLGRTLLGYLPRDARGTVSKSTVGFRVPLGPRRVRVHRSLGAL